MPNKREVRDFFQKTNKRAAPLFGTQEYSTTDKSIVPLLAPFLLISKPLKFDVTPDKRISSG